MPRSRDSDDDDDDSRRPSPLSQTQRFVKSGNTGSKDLKTTFSKPKYNEVPISKLNLNSDNDNSSSDLDDDTTSKTGRSTSSATPSQLTPKPRERSFLRGNTDKPKVQPRRSGIDDDDDRNVFGQTTMKPSPRHHISTLREDEERDQSFAQGFRDDRKRKSPTDMFNTDSRSRPTVNSRKLHSDQSDSDDPSSHNKPGKSNTSHKSPHSPTDHIKPSSRKSSTRSKGESDRSDEEDTENSNRRFTRQDYTKKRSSNHDLAQTSPKDTDFNSMSHQPSPSSRPGSASRKEVETIRRSSYCEDRDTVIPPVINQKVPSRPTSAKSNTTRQQTQSAIDNVILANASSTRDPLSANNDALAETLRPSTPPAPPRRPSAQLPPRPKPASNTTATHSTINKKPKYKVPTYCKDIGPRVDTGRASSTTEDLTKSIQRQMEKELKSLTLTRPQSARIRQNSASSTMNGTRRRRSSSAYENVKPRVNTNLSINFDELNTSHMRAESSQSIKDGVYLEWLKDKEDKKKLEKEELKRQKEEIDKRLNRNQIEGKVRQHVQNLETWRQTKDQDLRKKRREERALRREAEQQKKQAEQQKRKDANIGFESWTTKKQDTFKQKAEEERLKKEELEKRQKEKQDKFLQSETKVREWMDDKAEAIKKAQKEKKVVRNDHLKTIRKDEETKFVSAQEAYEKWLNDKEKYEIEDKIRTQRRNSLSAQQPAVPFLPGGSQKNTGRVRHVVW